MPLVRNYEYPSDMSSDLVVHQSPDDTEYRKEEEPYYWYDSLANGMLLPLIILVLYKGFMRIKRKLWAEI